MTTRRAFLATSAALAATPSLAVAATPTPKASPSEAPVPKLNFDVAAFNTQLDRDVAHKHLFTARKLDGGVALEAVRNTLIAYRDIGIASAEIAPVAVLYHGASIFMGMDDYVWDTYMLPFPVSMKQTLPEIYSDFQTVVNGKTQGNPLLKSPAPDGLHFYLCNNALDGFAHFLAGDKKKRPSDVYADFTTHLVPNASIVPAGVWAIHAIQERKYTLLQTS